MRCARNTLHANYLANRRIDRSTSEEILSWTRGKGDVFFLIFFLLEGIRLEGDSCGLFNWPVDERRSVADGCLLYVLFYFIFIYFFMGNIFFEFFFGGVQFCQIFIFIFTIITTIITTITTNSYTSNNKNSNDDSKGNNNNTTITTS